MKIKHISIILALCAAASSCSLLQGHRQQPQQPAAGSAISAEMPVGGIRTELPAPPKIAGERPDKATLCGGRWIIAGVGASAIVAEEEAPYIDFEDGSGRFYGSDGCNIINGDYLLRTDGAMVFSNVISTRRYCPDDEYSALISRYLTDGTPLYVDTRRIGQDIYLYLRTTEDRVVMTLRRSNMEFLNGNWQVAKIDGREINDEECNIFFDIRELKVHGNTGCNYFNGTIYIDPNRSNALDLSNMQTTRMGCPKGDQELRMMVALESTATAIASDRDDTVILLDAAGREMITLRRIPMPRRD